MGLSVPEREGYAPFLQSGAEILGPVDWVEDGIIAVTGQIDFGGEAFLACEGDIGDACCQIITDQLLDEDIGCSHRAVIGLERDVVAHRLNVRHVLLDQGKQPMHQFARLVEIKRRYAWDHNRIFRHGVIRNASIPSFNTADLTPFSGALVSRVCSPFVCHHSAV